ncbi:hypothetical protein FACS189472_10580 [Alphaproteobacteria bacterium]|nr:hypothetical protein FACS189472_10580 [Alphaproteobacteria bacterium]
MIVFLSSFTNFIKQLSNMLLRIFKTKRAKKDTFTNIVKRAIDENVKRKGKKENKNTFLPSGLRQQEGHQECTHPRGYKGTARVGLEPKFTKNHAFKQICTKLTYLHTLTHIRHKYVYIYT